MSRERRNRRFAEIVKGSEKLFRTVELIAFKENRSISDQAEFESYIADLRRRKVLVDLGPHPDGQRRRVSFRFDRLKNGMDMDEYIAFTSSSADQ